MTQYQQRDGTVEVHLENVGPMEVAGYPLIEGIKAWAVSLEGEARLDYVEFEDASGSRVQLSAYERDPFMRALYSEIMKEAGRECVREQFADALYKLRGGLRIAAREQAEQFRAGA